MQCAASLWSLAVSHNKVDSCTSTDRHFSNSIEYIRKLNQQLQLHNGIVQLLHIQVVFHALFALFF